MGAVGSPEEGEWVMVRLPSKDEEAGEPLIVSEKKPARNKKPALHGNSLFGGRTARRHECRPAVVRESWW